MRMTCDWHIHTHHSPECADAGATMAGIAAEIAAAGITEYGFTDHLHTVMNLPALEAARREFDALPPVPGRHFSVEVSVLRAYDHEKNAAAGAAGNLYGVWPGGPAGGWELALTDALHARLGVSYVIGGVHWPLGVAEPFDPMAVIRNYHAQLMFLATHPLVDIVAHPWWWMGAWQDDDGMYRTFPWLDDFGRIPAALHAEFADAVVAHGKAVEINAGAIMLNYQYPSAFRARYGAYLAALQARGVRFSIGSDSHAWRGGHPSYGAYLDEIVPDVAALGLRPEDLWRPARGPVTFAPA